MIYEENERRKSVSRINVLVRIWSEPRKTIKRKQTNREKLREEGKRKERRKKVEENEDAVAGRHLEENRAKGRRMEINETMIEEGNMQR